MGFFDIFRKKKKQEEVEFGGVSYLSEKETEENSLSEMIGINIHNKEERDNYIRNCCQCMTEANAELEVQKKEYQRVNDCLADIHELNNLPENMSDNLFLLAKEIHRLMSYRKEYQDNGKNRLSEEKYLKYRQFEEDMPKTLRKLEESEKYLGEIKSDLQQLEGERAVISYQKKSLSKERGNLRGISYILAITLTICVLLLFAMSSIWGMETQAGFYLVVLVTAIIAVYIFIKYSANVKEKQISERQMGKAITLLNKVKIKYVNTQNTIEYIHRKFGVNSSHELRFEWEQYQKMRREQEAFSRHGVELAYVQESFAKMLEGYPLRNPELWVKRADILVDEERLRQEIAVLENQRNIIQKNMEYNSRNLQNGKDSIERMIRTYPQYSKEILALVEDIDRSL